MMEKGLTELQGEPAGASRTGDVDARTADVDRLTEELVLASHILLRHGIVDAFGHVSVRHPHDRSKFLMARRIPPGLVAKTDVREFGLDGELIDPDETPVFLERFIHSEIFAKRPEINAIVHSHSPSIIAFGVVPTARLQPVCHTCGFLKDGAPLFEIREVAGDATNLLISSRDLGEALADAMGQSNVILMRGHGSTVVGTTLAQSVYRAIYTETNARIQASALQLGHVTFLSPGEAHAVEQGEHLQVERAWQLWKEEVAR
jgi:ribulose-5-phosphate 4-epimerase/fuculose-1-phosphate aldolase